MKNSSFPRQKKRIWGCKTALKFNTLSKPLNSAKSSNFYIWSIKKAASAQTLIWYEASISVRVSIKASLSWRQQPLLPWTCTAASRVTRSWRHCKDWCGAVTLPCHPACAARLSKDQNGWPVDSGTAEKHLMVYSRWYSFPHLSASPFFLFKKVKILLQKDFVLLVNQCVILTMQNGCQTLGGYSAIK